MSAHRYPAGTLAADLARGGAGLAATALPVAALDLGTAMSAVLCALAALFAAHVARTAARCAARVEVDDRAITAIGIRRVRLGWEEIASVKLNYYSTRRDGRGGWMQLKLNGRGGTLAIESTLDGFAEIVARAVRAATACGVELPPATSENLSLLGLPGGQRTGAA